jgi:hypothetical protein
MNVVVTGIAHCRDFRLFGGWIEIRIKPDSRRSDCLVKSFVRAVLLERA